MKQNEKKKEKKTSERHEVINMETIKKKTTH